MCSRQVLTLHSRDELPASADDHHYIFFEKKSVDGSAAPAGTVTLVCRFGAASLRRGSGIMTSVHTEDAPISDSVRNQALAERLRCALLLLLLLLLALHEDGRRRTTIVDESNQRPIGNRYCEYRQYRSTTGTTSSTRSRTSPTGRS
jgi:hypothetical protein